MFVLSSSDIDASDDTVLLLSCAVMIAFSESVTVSMDSVGDVEAELVTVVDSTVLVLVILAIVSVSTVATAGPSVVSEVLAVF